MDIRTYVRPNNIKTAQKILRKGRGAWGDFVNQALENYDDKRSPQEKVAEGLNMIEAQKEAK